MKRLFSMTTVWTTVLALAATSMVLAAGSASAASPPAARPTVPAAAGSFRSLPPFRLLDTLHGVGAPKAPVAAVATVHLQVTGQGGVPASGVSAVVLNLTVTRATRNGYLNVYRNGASRPGTSNLNFVKTETVSNLAIASVGTTGKVDLSNRSSGTIALTADVSGYYLSGAPTAPGAFVPGVPSRLLDTRVGVGARRGAVPAHGTVRLHVTGRGGIPLSGVAAVALNVTATAQTRAGFLNVYDNGAARPGTSCLNFAKAQTAANLVIARVGTGGMVTLYNGSLGAIQLVADVSGFYTPGSPILPTVVTPSGSPVPGYFESLPPARLLDTRAGVGVTSDTVPAGGTVALKVNGRGGIEASGVAQVALTVTVTTPARKGQLTVYASGSTRPAIPNLSFLAGQTVANLTFSPVGVDGMVDLYNGSGGPIQLVADTWGYNYLGRNSCSLTPAAVAHTC